MPAVYCIIIIFIKEQMDMKFLYRIFLVVFTVSTVFILSGCSALNFRHEYDKGMKAYNEKKYEEAIISFNNALNYNPDSYSTLCLLGTSYAYNNENKMAEKTFQDAIKLYPNNWNAYVFMGDLKRSQKDYDIAIEYYETAVTLESMGGREKAYYKRLLKEIKSEQASYNAKYQNILNKHNAQEETGIVNTYKPEEHSSIPQNPTGDVLLNLDMKKWEKAVEQKDEKSKIIEYGLKGEDVKNFKWTHLVTVQYFVLNDNFKTTLDSYFNNHIGAIEAVAKNSGKNFEKKIISQHKNDILYEWKFDNAKESEIARIIYSDKAIYHIHCAKKGAFSNDEKTKYLNLLKTAVLK